MKINHLLLFGISLIGITSVAQEKTSLTLDEAVKLAWTKSNEVTLANTEVNTKKHELQTVKNSQYPDFKISGQYQRLTKASVEMANADPNAAPLPAPFSLALYLSSNLPLVILV